MQSTHEMTAIHNEVITEVTSILLCLFFSMNTSGEMHAKWSHQALDSSARAVTENGQSIYSAASWLSVDLD